MESTEIIIRLIMELVLPDLLPKKQRSSNRKIIKQEIERRLKTNKNFDENEI